MQITKKIRIVLKKPGSGLVIECTKKRKKNTIGRVISGNSKILYSIRGSYLTDHHNRMLDNDVTLSYGIDFQSSARLNVNARKEYEYLPEDWSVRLGIDIPEGAYEGYSFSTWLSTDQSNSISASLNLSSSDYYSGKRHSIGGGIEFNRIKKLKFDADLHLNRINLPREISILLRCPIEWSMPFQLICILKPISI